MKCTPVTIFVCVLLCGLAVYVFLFTKWSTTLSIRPVTRGRQFTFSFTAEHIVNNNSVINNWSRISNVNTEHTEKNNSGINNWISNVTTKHNKNLKNNKDSSINNSISNVTTKHNKNLNNNKDSSINNWISKQNITDSFSSRTLIRIYQKDIQIEDMDLDQSNWTSLNKSTYHLPRQKNCAVVGNSGILRNSSCGKDIDSNDFVIRCNIPDVDNYVKDVGKQTNINIVFQTTILDLYALCKNATVRQSIPAERLHVLNNSILWYPESFRSKQVTNETAKEALNCIETKFHLQFQFAISATHDFTGKLKRLLKLEKPTTGMRAIVAALILCEHVNVYGFYPYAFDQNGNNLPYHYYGPFIRVDRLHTSHNYSAEFHTLQTLHKRNVLRLVTDGCII